MTRTPSTERPFARRPSFALPWLVAASGVFACNVTIDTGPGAPHPELVAPPRPGFGAVADAMQATCATLDCHGQEGRNLRLYGARGLRLDPNENPSGGPTTDAEYESSYWSTVGLEPELMTSVVADQGADPERLTLFRKARETERHKGKRSMSPGDPLDRCLTSWVSGTIDDGACDAAVMASVRPRPPEGL